MTEKHLNNLFLLLECGFFLRILTHETGWLSMATWPPLLLIHGNNRICVSHFSHNAGRNITWKTSHKNYEKVNIHAPISGVGLIWIPSSSHPHWSVRSCAQQKLVERTRGISSERDIKQPWSGPLRSRLSRSEWDLSRLQQQPLLVLLLSSFPSPAAVCPPDATEEPWTGSSLLEGKWGAPSTRSIVA